MANYSEDIKQTSRDFSKHFDFLVNDFGLKVCMESYPQGNNMGNFVRVFRNAYVQVELAGSQSFFHAEIRRLVNNKPRPYYEEENNIGFEKLAVLSTNNTYDHMDYYIYSVGWNKVLENTAQLFRISKEVFTTDKWVDTQKIEQLEDEDFLKRFGFKPSDNKHKPTFFGLIKKHALKLNDKGFQLKIDSSELPPYDSESLTQKIIMENDTTTIMIYQNDWRDDYLTYCLEINGVKRLAMNLSKYKDIEHAARVFNEALDQYTLYYDSK
ncbi:MAG: hypothetical protein K0R51_757 [Cytophagaceae bacterium]|jgi:hypothetical protein|nr:hypothetical protein [Cytophagaceae bacterium]